jgi:hypothetical protein
VPLPGWIYVHESYACPPELALGPKGEAVVTSNVIPTLWRVDPSTLEVSEHPLALDVDDGSELGFTAIAYSTEHAAYFAISGAHGTLWKIDPSLRLAQKIPLSEPVLGACGMTVHSRFAAQKGPRYSRLCAAGPSGRWTIDLAPDQRAGYARAASFQECPVSAGLAFREE